MKYEGINISRQCRRVLVAPLDWGLGHATRCIPIIYELIKQDIEVVIAADGGIKNLLKKEFPDVVFTVLEGYQIRYSSRGAWLPLKLFLQFPALIKTVRAENKWLHNIIDEYKIDAVISDNRLGLYTKAIPCIYITHQLQIKTGSKLTEWFTRKIHYRFINKYNACWIPDNSTGDDLAGDLSHPKKMPQVPVKYLGPLSRFEKSSVEKKIDLLVLLSGPEPQRTLFENILIAQLKDFTGTAVLVKGLPGEANEKTPLLYSNQKLTVINHLDATALNQLIQQSQMIISRSGYTTIMDLVKLQQKAILVPTPGQTEQEYLANYLMQRHLFFSVPQADFLLQDALQKAAAFSYTIPTINQDNYKEVIREFIKTTFPFSNTGSDTP
ncbi:glycosyltransferase [Ferruginibacter sp.]